MGLILIAVLGMIAVANGWLSPPIQKPQNTPRFATRTGNVLSGEQTQFRYNARMKKVEKLYYERRLLILAMFCATWLLPSWVSAQKLDADAVIEKHIEALGGSMQLRTLGSFKATCVYTGPDLIVHWNEETLYWNAQDGKYQYWIDAKGRFWEKREGKVALRPEPPFPGFIHLPVHCLAWLDSESLKKANLGLRELNDKEYWCVKMEAQGQHPANYFFDRETGLLFKIETENGKSCRMKYAELNGVFMATELSLGDNEESRREFQFKSLEFDPDHGEIDFEFPKDLVEEYERREIERK